MRRDRVTTAPAPPSLPQSLWSQVEDYRYGHRIPSETAAVRRLIAIGLRHQDEEP